MKYLALIWVLWLFTASFVNAGSEKEPEQGKKKITLETQKVDMILSGMTMTPKRNLKVAFVGPFFISAKGILTKTEHIAALQSAAGLNKAGFSIAAIKDSTSEMFPGKGFVTNQSMVKSERCPCCKNENSAEKTEIETDLKESSMTHYPCIQDSRRQWTLESGDATQTLECPA